MQSRFFSAIRSFWIPVVLGTVAFWLFTGGTILDPSNLAWILNQGDPKQHYIGWSFFRQQPFFQIPFGANTSLGEVLGSSVVFTDSIPLMAFLFRPFSDWLPTEFQYFGLWILICFILQGIFAWKILERFLSDRWALALGCSFFMISPIMLFRMLGHEALIGQWVILAAIHLYLMDRSKAIRWAILVGVTCLIHAYLVAMVGGIWFFDLSRRVLARSTRITDALREAIGVFVALILTTWIAGYFVDADPTQGMGFGIYRFNLMAPFSPMGLFSTWIPLHLSDGDYEGFAYLGLGMITLTLAALVGLAMPGTRRITHRGKFIALMVLCAVLFAYAVSNRIGWGNDLLWQYEVPPVANPITATFRASGRFIWPVIYLLQVAVIVVVFTRFPRRVAVPLVVGCLVIQGVEISTASQFFRERWSESWVTPLASNFWSDAAQRYRRIARTEPRTDGPDPLPLIAAHYGMSVNSGHLARVSKKRLEKVREEMAQEVRSGNFRKDTLYVFEDEATLREASVRAGGEALAMSVDGLYVLAPNWCLQRPRCEVHSYEQALRSTEPKTIDFRLHGNAGLYQRAGWSVPEEAGTWTDGNLAVLDLPIQHVDSEPVRLRLRFAVFIAGEARKQRVTIAANGRQIVDWNFKAGNGVVARDIVVPADTPKDDRLKLEFRLPDAMSPSEAGIGKDERKLSISMQSIDIMPSQHIHTSFEESTTSMPQKR